MTEDQNELLCPECHNPMPDGAEACPYCIEQSSMNVAPDQEMVTEEYFQGNKSHTPHFPSLYELVDKLEEGTSWSGILVLFMLVFLFLTTFASFMPGR